MKEKEPERNRLYRVELGARGKHRDIATKRLCRKAKHLLRLFSYYSNRWLTCIVVDPITNKGLTREEIRLAMEAENIESRPLWKPMHQQPVFASSKNYLNGVSDKLFENGLCLPSGSNLTEDEFHRIFNCLEIST